MAFFKDIWKNTVNPDKQNKFLTGYAQQLLQGGEGGRWEKFGNKLLGGLMLGGQNQGAANEKAANKAERAGILGKMFAEPTGGTGAGPGSILQPEMAPAMPPKMAQAGGILGGVLGQPGSGAADIAAQVVDGTPPPGAMPDLTEKQRILGRMSVSMLNSDDEEIQGVGAAMFQKAIKDETGYEVVGNNVVMKGPDGRPIFFSPPGVKKPISVPKDGTVYDVQVGPDGKETTKVYHGKDSQATQKRDKFTHTRVNEEGYKESRQESWVVGPGNTKQSVSFTDWQPASNQEVQGQMLSGDVVYKRSIQQNLDAAEQLNQTYGEIKAKIEDPIHGQDYLDLFTAQGKIDQFFQGTKAFLKITDEDDADFQKAQRGYAFMSDVQDAANRYIKEITGAQMSEAEATRLLKAIANSTDNKAAFMGKLDAQMARIQRTVEFYTERVRNLMDGGLNAAEAKELAGSEAQRDLNKMYDELDAESEARVRLGPRGGG